MLNTKSFLAVDFGAGSLKLAEFEINESGGLRLKQFGLRPLGPEGAQESKREAVLLKALPELLTEKGIKARSVNVCAPGFQVFSKFVKLPAVESGKVSQIIQYEAQQNVPFPLEEVVWDYQILGSTAGGELEVLLVAVKSEIIEGLFRVVEAGHLSLQLADASAAALCNAFRYNYGELEDCTMLLDIGAKTSNLLFFEKGKVFSRSINIGANAITQDFLNETKQPWPKAEDFKLKEGFVSLGGAYEEPENPQAAALSKIARQFMTRLHIQVNQTMQFYRGQQGGSMPARVFLAGGASIMTYTAQFFADKLNVPVEYFNPLRNVQIDPAINLEDLARVAHSLGEVVGLGLRNLAHCPVELSLMPKSTRRWQTFNQKKPYFMATVFCLTLVVFASGYLFNKLAQDKQQDLEKIKAEIDPKQQKQAQFEKVMAELARLKNENATIIGWMEDRYYWADLLTELRQVLIRTEASTKARFGGRDTGVWVEKLLSAEPAGGASADTFGGTEATPSTPASATSGMTEEQRKAFQRRYGIFMPGGRSVPAPAAAEVTTAPASATAVVALATSSSNEVSTIKLVCRAVSLSSAIADANTTTAFTFLHELEASPFSSVDPKDPTRFDGGIGTDEPPGTFTFSVIWKLKRPLKL